MQIITEIEGAILRLQINRPEKKNALTLAMYSDLASALDEAERCRNVRVVLIHGQADAFTAGNDLQDFLNNPPIDEDAPVRRFMFALSALSKPIVAAVAGPAIGVGTTMLLHCDLVYAAENTRFQLPFVNLGVLPEVGSSLLLPMQIGYRRAAELLMLGDPFSAATALQYGLITGTAVNGEAALDAAMAAARKLAAKPPAALRLTKTLMKKNNAEAVVAQMREENARFVERLGSPETAEAIKAVLEKRAPNFSQPA